MNTPSRNDAPIFVVGAGRSGTTLMQSLLSAHGRIAVTPETHFCAIWEQRTGLPVAAPGADFEAGWRGYLSSARFADLGVTPERARAVLERGAERTARSALAALMTAYGEAHGKPRVGEKTPGHWRWAPTLLDWFPDARVIVMRRDPRAVVSSKMKASWAPRYMRFHGTALRRLTRLHVVSSEGQDWADIYGRAVPALLSDPRVMLVGYEELAGAPEGIVRDVCAFLGETFEPAMLGDRSDQAAADGPGTASRWGGWRAGHLAASRRPVNAASIEKWKADLTPREVAAIEAMACDVMEAAGYAATSTPAARRAARSRARLATALGTIEVGARTAVGRVVGTMRRVRSGPRSVGGSRAQRSG